MARRRRSINPRKGAEPVPVQIITILALGPFGIRYVAPNVLICQFRSSKRVSGELRG